MPYPSISQWIDTVANPRGRFRTLGEFESLCDAYGNVKFTAGNSAAVFPVIAGDRRMMLKCFIKEGGDRQALYGITSGGDPILSPTRLLPGEAYVYDDLGNGAFYGIAVGEWVEGSTLETETGRAAREFGVPRFAELVAMFDNLATELLAREWAHGDLKPDNIVITHDGRAVLIDYDAMYVPGGQPMGEAGTPGFQHPARTGNDYGKHLDDYPVALISISLHALAADPGFYAAYHKGDGLILNPEEICSGHSEAYDRILDLFAGMGEYGLYGLALKLRRPTLEIPELAETMARITATPGRGYGHEGVGGLKRNNKYKSGDETAPLHSKLCELSGPPRLFEVGGLWGYRSTDGAEITDAIFDEAFEFSDGLGVAKLRDRWHAVDTTGRMVFNTGQADLASRPGGTSIAGSTDGAGAIDALKPFGCGLAAFRRGGKWGYLDKAGREAILPSYDRAGTMHEGLAAVRMDGKYGFIDTSGKTSIPFVYDRARGFRGGQAEVEADGEIFRIDLSGKRV